MYVHRYIYNDVAGSVVTTVSSTHAPTLISSSPLLSSPLPGGHRSGVSSKIHRGWPIDRRKGPQMPSGYQPLLPPLGLFSHPFYSPFLGPSLHVLLLPKNCRRRHGSHESFGRHVPYNISSVCVANNGGTTLPPRARGLYMWLFRAGVSKWWVHRAAPTYLSTKELPLEVLQNDVLAEAPVLSGMTTRTPGRQSASDGELVKHTTAGQQRMPGRRKKSYISAPIAAPLRARALRGFDSGGTETHTRGADGGKGGRAGKRAKS